MIRYIPSLLVLLVLLVAPGCSESGAEGSRASESRSTSVTEQQAIDIAKSEIAKQHAWANTATYVARPAGLGWTVTATHDEGGFGMVNIGGDGSVIKVAARDG